MALTAYWHTVIKKKYSQIFAMILEKKDFIYYDSGTDVLQ